MSLELIEGEIRRFLSTREPEVLCIKGRWGVGKTYGWKKFLVDGRAAKAVALQRYSYVSLFGLNSLDDLRFSVFESTTSGDRIGSSPDDASFSELVNKGGDFARRMRPVVDLVSTILNRRGVTDLLFKSAFLTVRNQIVCLDDLERAGAGLSARDVLGLASFLKEERHCKVVLLLNDKEHDDKDDFERHLEKVADLTLVFDLTPEEAARIALTDTDRATTLVKPLVIKLGITNIRVIKKVERLAKRLVAILQRLDDEIVERAVATLVLASWSVQQPNEAPPLDFLKSYNRITIAMRAGREEVDGDTQKYRAQIADYPFRGPEEIDRLVIEGAAAGFFQSDEVREAADALELEGKTRSRDSAFSQTWEQLYHGSLATDDGTFLDALHKSAIDEASAISPLNINSAVRMLREFDRPEQADEVIVHYVEAHEEHGPEFFDIGRHHFSRDDRLDDNLRAAFEARRRDFIDARDPFAVLTSIGERGVWSDADAALMARQSTDDFERLFESLEGEILRPAIQMILAMGSGHTEVAQAVRAASVAALRKIGAKSPIRAGKIAGYGIGPEEPGDEAAPDGQTPEEHQSSQG